MTCSRNLGRAPRSPARALTPFEVAVSNEKPTPRCHLAGDGPAHPGCGTNDNVGHPTGPFTPEALGDSGRFTIFSTVGSSQWSVLHVACAPADFRPDDSDVEM
jgi:hypothetical protein